MAAMRALLAGLVLLAPAALATWSASPASHAEPSTLPDETDGHMWPDAASGHEERLYFAGDLTPVEGNPSARRFVAWLGYWKDCNRDGYVGILGVDGYSSSLAGPNDDALCPPGSPNNRDGVVKEFFWVGPGSRDVDDPGARIWADWGLPGAPVPAAFGAKTAPDDALTFHPDAEGPKWIGGIVWLTSSQGDVRPGESTQYASVPTAAPSALPGAPGVYGAGPCPAGGAGWECDRNLWMGPVKVGDAFHLRDVDCHDLARQPGGAC